MIWVIDSNTPGSLKFLFFWFLCLDFVSDWIWAARWGLSCSGQHPFKVKVQIPFKPFVLNVGSSFTNISTNTKFRCVVAGGGGGEWILHIYLVITCEASSVFMLSHVYYSLLGFHLWRWQHFLSFFIIWNLPYIHSIATKTSILKSLLPLVLHG